MKRFRTTLSKYSKRKSTQLKRLTAVSPCISYHIQYANAEGYGSVNHLVLNSGYKGNEDEDPKN